MRPYSAGVNRCGAALWWTLLGLVGPAWALDDRLPTLTTPGGASHLSSDAAAPLFFFDLPAQPLHAALNRFADISGQPALYPSEIVDGRHASAVRGHYSAETALQILLQGTGLVADRRTSGLGHTFVLQGGVASAKPRGGMAELFSAEGFAGLVQAGVWRALCANHRTRPGEYSALLRVHIEMDGRIGGARLLGTSGDLRRDAALLGTLRSVHINRSPPASIVRQPLTIMVTTNDPDTGPQCSQLDGAD